MRYFYDTEFIENGSTVDLISIGIVAEDGREYYAVQRPTGDVYQRVQQHDWLMKNVVPQLPDPSEPEWKSKSQIRDEVADFLHPLAVIPGTFKFRGNPELWAWYGAYDHLCLAQLFGTMMDLPPYVPMWTNDLRQEQHRRGNPPLPQQPSGLHNALEDARHLKVQYDYLHKAGNA